MQSKSGLSALVLAVGIVAGGAVPAFAQGLGQSGGGQPLGWHQGWHMGPMMGQGQMPMMGQGQAPMMGQGQAPMMGQGQAPMMGQGQMPMMGQGQAPMMGQGQMPMMGQGQMPMMGQGQMPMMGRGMMGQGMGPGMMRPLAKDLSASDVQHMMEHRLAWQGNPNLKVGKVEEKDDHTVVAEIVTKEGSLVQRLEVDRHRGSVRPVQ